MRRFPFSFLILPLAAVLFFPGCAGKKSGAGAALPSEAKPPAAKTAEVSWKLKKKPASAGEHCEKSACFEKIENFQGIDFRFQGAGLRKYLWIDIYTAGFYLPDSDVKLKYGIPQGAKMIILEYHRPVEKKKIIESIENKVYTLPYVDQEAVKARFQQLTHVFVTPGSGSRYTFIYVPGRGTALLYNGEERILIPGEDFANAFFGVWLYEKDAGPIREELLGKA